ncbi:MAG: CinA family nicotinamide mononucleotide deamidase-related protein [Tannerella sp.]|jgi:nicotinamide-nucleotide amidase|nr:CinA family nicotinamide mononucleotide deamidase-related protein [Tannerella sp.]
MNVEIITIGDELLIGQVIDTNSAWMANMLNDNGLKVTRKVTVGDMAEDIAKAIDDAFKNVSIVLLTGGLGLTKDDLTLKTLCKYFDSRLHFSNEVFANIKEIMKERTIIINELTRSQAMVPDKATVIQNKMGTAPCTWFERNSKVLISMPGVPYEMKWLMSNEIIPKLKKRFKRDIFIKHCTIMVSGLTESELAVKLKDFENDLPDFVRLAYLPQAGIIRLRLSAYFDIERKVNETVNTLKKQLSDIVKEYIIYDEDRKIEVIAGEELRKRGLTIGTAESCTGGAIASLITSVPGSSDYFVGSIVSYSNIVKTNILGVPIKDLEVYGAVSKQVVEQMAQGALRSLGCNYVIATSGIAGPGGGTETKPVGTVWIAVANKEKVISEEHHFTKEREQNIACITNVALMFLVKNLQLI